MQSRDTAVRLEIIMLLFIGIILFLNSPILCYYSFEVSSQNYSPIYSSVSIQYSLVEINRSTAGLENTFRISSIMLLHTIWAVLCHCAIDLTCTHMLQSYISN